MTTRSALVTGTSSGIGKAIALRLLDDGWSVIGMDRAPPVLIHIAFRHVEADLADAEARAGAIAPLAPVNALVHAAGVMRGGKLGELDHASGQLLWSIHVDAAIALADHLAPAMPDGGRIVLIGSRAARGVIGKSQYGAAKAALTGLARSWAKELITRGITVNVIAPAATETDMLTDPNRSIIPPETPPLGRRIKPEEIAALAAYLLSPEAAPVTGQEIGICGGASL